MQLSSAGIHFLPRLDYPVLKYQSHLMPKARMVDSKFSRCICTAKMKRPTQYTALLLFTVIVNGVTVVSITMHGEDLFWQHSWLAAYFYNYLSTTWKQTLIIQTAANWITLIIFVMKNKQNSLDDELILILETECNASSFDQDSSKSLLALRCITFILVIHQFAAFFIQKKPVLSF